MTQPNTNRITSAFEIERMALTDTDHPGAYRVALLTGAPLRRATWSLHAPGGKFDNYLRNPVVMWAHDYSQPPIARAVSIEPTGPHRIESTFEFPPAGAYAFADTVATLWRAGFINGASIGFDPITFSEDADRASEPPTGEHPTIITEWEMYEFSIVPIPRDAGALRASLEAFDHAEELLALANTPPDTKPPACTSLDPALVLDFLKTLKGAIE